ncbi:MAG TPA: hypothetical protein VNK82_07245 [Terriglobales bacterium]|nr:hypothetical protein [Terriglobales bacterium]
MRTENVSAEIERLQGRLAEVEQRRAAAQARIGILEGDRRGAVVTAVSDGDARAQKRLREIDAELESLRRQEADLGTAAVGLGERIESLQRDLETAQHSESFATLQGLREMHLSKCAQLEKLTQGELIPLLRDIEGVAGNISAVNGQLGGQMNVRERFFKSAVGYVIALLHLEFPLERAGSGSGESAYWFEFPAETDTPEIAGLRQRVDALQRQPLEDGETKDDRARRIEGLWAEIKRCKIERVKAHALSRRVEGFGSKLVADCEKRLVPAAPPVTAGVSQASGGE